ncbi:MAG: hypothetical protein HQM08_21285 [Candidatus Riflebacteria bacterium]|nr:hypothetical protein [Candidatus Riflebacteria bacterium]
MKFAIKYFYMLLFLSILTNYPLSAQNGQPFREDITITLPKSVKVTEKPTTYIDVIAELNKLPAYEVWNWAARENVLLEGAKKLSSAMEIIALQRETINPTVKNQIILNGIHTPKNFAEVQLLVDAATNSSVKDKVISENIDICSNWAEYSRLSELASNPSIKNEVITKGILKTDSLGKAIFLAERSSSADAEGKALLEKCTPFAKTPFDYQILARNAIDPYKSKILLKALGIFNSFEDLYDLGSLSGSPNVKNAFAEKLLALGTAKSDMDKILPFANNSNLLNNIQQLKDQLPDNPPAYRDCAQLMNEIKTKWGVNIHDNLTQQDRWTYQQLQWIDGVFQTLPKEFIKQTSELIPVSGGNPFVFGSTIQASQLNKKNGQWVNAPPIVRMHEMGERFEIADGGGFKGTLVHEMAHAVTFQNPSLLYAWENQFWPGGKNVFDPATAQNIYNGSLKSPSVSDYGNTEPKEDFAESARLFWQDPVKMKKEFPDRYQFMKDKVFKMEFLG